MKAIKFLALIIFVSISAMAVKSILPAFVSISSEQAYVTPTDDYNKLWAKADSLLTKGLTRSALDVVEVIYNKAKSETHTGNFVKSVIYKLRLESYISEDDYIKEINTLTKEIEEVKFPIKPVLHSMIAEVYWKYYQSNRYRFLNRTETVDFVPEDIRTWDLRKIIEKVIQHYKLSLEDSENLKKNAINIYNDILVTNNASPEYRPTLYDFLAHRAIDFFMNEEPGLVSPINKFEINEEIYSASQDQFSKHKITSEDPYSLRYYACVLFQDLIRFHQADANPNVLIDVDLKRLDFVYNKSIHPDKDTLYVQALDNLINRYESFPSSTEVIFKKAEYYYREGSKYSYLSNESPRWKIKKAFQICQEAIDKFPDAFGSKNCKVLQSKITDKSLSFQTEEINSGNLPSRALVTYKNVNEIYIRIAKISYTSNDKILSNDYEYDKIVAQYLKLTPLKEFSVQLKNPDDYQIHSTEIKIPELEKGFYIMLIGTNKDFATKDDAVCYSSFWVSNMAYMKRALSNGHVQHIVTNRNTGAPIKGVGAQVYKQVYNYTSRKYEYHKSEYYITDDNGMFISVPDGNDYYNYFAELNYNKDILKTEIFYQYRINNYDRKKYLRTTFFTDRLIYRPGQTLYFKGIVLETDGETSVIKPGESTTVTLYDVNYQKVSELNLISNEYGTFNGQFIIPKGLLNGQMHIGDTWGNLYFSVEEYKRPKFEVSFEPIKGTYKLNEKVNIKGLAKSYAGANIDQAKVQYRVVRTASFPYWWYYWYGYYPNSPKMEIANGTVVTDANGEFTIDFTAIPDFQVSKKTNPTFNYEITADITDLNGETQSNKTNLRLGYQALQVGVDLPETIEKSNEEEYTISTTNLSGNYEYAAGTIKIHRLKQAAKLYRSRLWGRQDSPIISKEDYYQWFPNDLYADENNTSQWSKEIEVLSINFDTKKDSLLDLKNLKTWSSGQYVLEITSTDKYGEKVQSFSYFTVYSEKDKTIPITGFDWFTVLKEKGEPGEEASFLIGTLEMNVSVLIEVEVKNQIIQKQWMPLNNELKKVSIPILEAYRGNFAVHFTFVTKGRAYSHDVLVQVPYTNKTLDVSFETFRNKLLPGQTEEWKIKIKGKNGEKVAAEMLATMYDASLDAFRSNQWLFNIYNQYYMQRSWEKNSGFSTNTSQLYSTGWNPYKYYNYRTYQYLNWFGYEPYYYGSGYRYYDDYDGDEIMLGESISTGKNGYSRGVYKETANKKGDASEDLPMTAGLIMDATSSLEEMEKSGEKSLDGREQNQTQMSGEAFGPGAIKTRTNFNETAFFYPQLKTNENGEIIISFTVPESLTKWKFMGLAHTKDLMYGQIQKEIITQKELMVVPNPPRFFRENDRIIFSSKITNLSNDSIHGKVSLMLFNAETQQPIDFIMKNIDPITCFDIPKGQSTSVEWELFIPENIPAITYKVVAQAGNFTDGEEMIVPVLTNRMLVTETLPLPIRGNQTKNFQLEKLINAYKSNTLKNYKISLEFTGNPSWYAIQALPYLIEYPYECTEQIFSRFYANSIATHIANSSPTIKTVFESWKNETPDALLSNLEKNQDLKYLMLQETPWVFEAKNESQSKRNIGVLLDSKRMENEIEQALRKIERLQLSNGGWTWFSGMPDDRYITQHIITGFCHLDKLGVRDLREKQRIWNMIRKGSHYLDDRITDDYNNLLRYYPGTMHENHLNGIQIQYLYARSYFSKDIAIEVKNKKAFDYFVSQAKKYWLSNNRYLQGMIALGLNRLGDKITPIDITKSLKENAIFNEEMGMYWKDMSGGYYWYQAPIETQALLIECFDEVANDQKSVEEMKVWLLKQKQTQNWKTTKATAEACYALLLRGSDWLAKDPQVHIMLGNIQVDPKAATDSKQQAGTGYFRTSWMADAITPDMGKVKVTKSDDGVAWGALYWQYFEQLDKITPAETPLKIVKQLFVERNSAHGPVIEPIKDNTILKVGDKVKVRIELRVDREMEYIHMKDMRASGFEPVNVISKYKYQDGLGYYESTGDAATNFFISYLPKGTFVFEYPLRIAQKGDFSNGVTSIQCMYAPEFSAHSEGVRVKVSG